MCSFHPVTLNICPAPHAFSNIAPTLSHLFVRVTQCASHEVFFCGFAQITLSCSIILRARNMCCLFHIFPITLTFQVKKDELTAPSGKSAVKLPEVQYFIFGLYL